MYVCTCVCVCVCADSREAVYANTLISAALTYDIAVACREKQLPDCPCSSDLPFLTRLPDGAVLLGGCGDNVAYGADTTWSFVHGEGSEGEPSMRKNMSTHNHNLALNVSRVCSFVCRFLIIRPGPLINTPMATL